MNALLAAISPSIVSFLLLLICGGILLVLLALCLVNPILFRMSVRNMRRHPSQTLIMFCGLMLSTLFIMASFGLNDSFTNSVKTYRLQQLGQVNEAVTGRFSQSQFTQAITSLRQQPGVTATGIVVLRNEAQITSMRTSLTTLGLDLYGIPTDFAQVYGPLIDQQGKAVHIADLGANETVVSATVAHITDIRVGDTLQINTQAGTMTKTVTHILASDIVVTSGELLQNAPFPEILLPLATVQQMYKNVIQQTVVPDAICVHNDTAQSQAVLQTLQQVFHVLPLNVHGQIPGTTSFNGVQIHPLEPGVVDILQDPPFSSGRALYNSAAGRQYSLLLPAFTWLLVSAGMLLLILLCLLLTAERRVESGVSRAIGLQRNHLVQMLVIECCGYGIIAALLGVPLGVGAINLELAVLAQLPSVNLGPGASSSSAYHVPLHFWVSWQSVINAWCLEVLITLVVVFIAALWISRLNIVAAIRDGEDTSSHAHTALSALWKTLWSPPYDAQGQLIQETPARRLSRRLDSSTGLLWGLFSRGPLCLVLGAAFLVGASALKLDWMQIIGAALLIAGGSLLLNWVSMHLGTLWSNLTQRIGFSLLGIGWLIYGWQASMALFLAALAPIPGSIPATDTAPLVLISTLLQVMGIVILVMTNIDVVVGLLSFLFKRIRSLAPISRISFVYPLTFRLRTHITVTLLSMITFLIMLLITNNLGQVQQGQVQVTTGNFHLEMNLTPHDQEHLGQQIQHLGTTLPQKVAAVSLMQPLYDPVNLDQTTPKPVRLLLPGKTPVITGTEPLGGPLVVDNTFLSGNTIPMLARAAGFSSDQQIWDAVKNHSGYAVMRYDSSLKGLPSNNGFTPFVAEVPDSALKTASYRDITIIGLLPANVYWKNILLSTSSAAQITQHLSIFTYRYYIRLQPGVTSTQASSDIGKRLQVGNYAIQIVTLEASDANTFTTNLTLFLAGYLAIGLIFGALSIGVIVSRAVVERRQQVGMLRALGFTRGLVLSSFLLESSFVITLSLLIGIVLAWWLALQVARQLYQNFPIPIIPIVLILLGSYLIAIICTIIPARKASHIPPAEALRYE